MYDHIGQYERAWKWIQLTNEAKRKLELEVAYGQSALAKDNAFYLFLDGLRRIFLPYSSIQLPKVSESVYLPQPRINRRIIPIFIMGLPRSGTTLVERVLSWDSMMVFAAGEIDTLSSYTVLRASVQDNLDVTVDTSVFTAENCTLKRLDYLKQLESMVLERSPHLASEQHSSMPLYVIDKLPMNWRSIPLIKILFPEAKLILLKRDLQSVALSNYFVDYAPPYQLWSHKLDTIEYRMDLFSETIRQWKVWFNFKKKQGFFNDDLMYELKYEEAVAQPLSVFERLFNYIGIPWNPKCLEFYKSKQTILTASGAQIRSPIYARSISKWRNYDKFLIGTPLEKYMANGPTTCTGQDDDGNKELEIDG